jgi:hypothetical protein
MVRQSFLVVSVVAVAAAIGACTTGPDSDKLKWTLTPTEGAIGLGGAEPFLIHISSKANINSDLDLSITPSPIGMVIDYLAHVTSTATTVEGTFHAAPGTELGLYTFDVNLREQGTEFGLPQQFRLTVVGEGETPDFAVGQEPDALTMPVETPQTVVFRITPLNGYTGTVNISAGDLPNDVQLVAGPSPPTFTFAAGEGGKGGTILLSYNPVPPVPGQVALLVTVSDGTITHSRTLTLTLPTTETPN